MAKETTKGTGFVTSAPMQGYVANGGPDSWTRADFQATRFVSSGNGRNKKATLRLVSRRTRRIERRSLADWRSELD